MTLLMHTAETADISGWIAEAFQGGAQGRRALAALLLIAVTYALKRAIPYLRREKHLWLVPWATLAMAVAGSAVAMLAAGKPWHVVLGKSIELGMAAVGAWELAGKHAVKAGRRALHMRRESKPGGE